MANKITIHLFGKRYTVPDNLTIIKAIEYCGYELTTGIGCRHGFCGACACVYRIRGERELHYCLACETKVQDKMYIATLPYFPLEKQVYEIDEIKPDKQIMMQLYPEIYSCIGCNRCTQVCPQGLDVKQYIAYAQEGDFKACADESFNCIMCNCCSTVCPAQISHPEVAMLARRLNGRYVTPKAEHLEERVAEIRRGGLTDDVKDLMHLSDEEIREKYADRDIEE